jgi:hypothetical protein
MQSSDSNLPETLIDAPDAGAQSPSTATRTLVSFLLLVHLFSVALTLLAYDRTSSLHHRLRRLMSFYVEPLNFDVASRDVHSEDHSAGAAPRRLSNARYHLTYAQEADTDVRLSVMLEGEQLPEPPVSLLWVTGSNYSPVHRRRLALSALASELSQDRSTSAILPVAIGGALMRQHGADSAQFTAWTYSLQEIDAINSDDSEERDPLSEQYLRTVFEGNLVKVDGEITYLPAVEPAHATRAVREDESTDP